MAGSYIPAMDWSPLSQLGDTITTNLQKGQKQQSLSQLGDKLKSGDYAGATQIALQTGDLPTALSLYKLGTEQEAGRTAQGIVSGQPQGNFLTSPAPGDASAPRGLRNANPGNIEDGGFAKSQQGYLGNDGRFARFDTLDNGIRAQSNLLASYDQKGVNTVSGIVNRWAPSAENGAATGNYSAFVAKKLGVGPSDPLDLRNPDVRTRVASAMAEFENGRPVRVADATGSVPASAGQWPDPQAGSDAASGLIAKRDNIMRALQTPGLSDTAAKRLQLMLDDTKFQIERADKEANRSPVSLSEGQILVDPRTGRQIAQGGPKNDVSRQNAQREAEAARFGLQGEDRTQYVLNGKLATGAEKQTGEQANAATFATRMNEADKIISDPAIYGSGMGTGGALRNIAAGVPVVGNMAIGATEGGAAFQKYDQAKRDFANAVLRKESGAAISQSEFDNADKQYFPRPGDTPEVIAQKAKNRATAIDTIGNAGAPSFRKDFAEKRAGGAQSNTSGLKMAPGGLVSEAQRVVASGRLTREEVAAEMRRQGYDPSGL